MKTAFKGMDPRTKLVIVLCLSTLGVFIQDIHMLAGILLVSGSLSAAFGSRLFSVVKKMRKVLGLFAAIAVVQSVFAPSGENLLTIGGFTLITSGGLSKGISMVLRMSIVLVSATIMSTSNSREIIQGLVQWKIPYEIAFMVSVGIRFLPTLSEEMKNVVTAVQLRGVDLDKIPFRQRFKIYSYLVMPVVSGAMIKSRELSTAMETRAFRAYPERTSYMILSMKARDYYAIIVSLMVCAVTLLCYYRLS